MKEYTINDIPNCSANCKHEGTIMAISETDRRVFEHVRTIHAADCGFVKIGHFAEGPTKWITPMAAKRYDLPGGR